jgi:hypothetical protein
MAELLITSFLNYYGLDWLAFASGMAGMILITKQSRWGFVFCALSSLSGVAVALMSLQFGYIVYNAMLVMVMAKGYVEWAKPVRVTSQK